MESATLAPYLDDDGNEIKADSSVKLPKGYQLLSTKKSPAASKKKVKELKDEAAKRRPATPPPGYLITSSPYATPDLTSNPKGEGLYEMYGRTGQGDVLGSFKVPYSKVQQALTIGATFYNGSDSVYAKDKEAEGKPLSWYQQILQSPALQPVPNDKATGPIGNKEKAFARTVLSMPEYVGQLVDAAKRMHAGDVSGGDDFANLINPAQIPKQMYDSYIEDAKKDPKMAMDNLVGNMLGLIAVGAVTHGVAEKATHALSGHPYTPIEQSEIPTRERTNVLHRNGAGEVRQAKGQAPAVWLSPDAWKSLMGELYPEEDASQTNGFNLPANDALLQFATEHKPVNPSPTFTDVQKLLAEAHKGAGQGGVAIAKNRPSIAKNVNVLREELNHTWQRGLANGNVNQHLDPQAFTNLYHAIPSGLYDHLVENGYSGQNSPEMVAEAAVRMMDGRPEQFGVTEDDAVDFLDKYFKSVTEKHGAKALEELHHVRGIAADAKARAIEQHTRGGQDNQSVSGVVDGGQGGAKEGVQTQGDQVNPAEDTLFNREREKEKPIWYLKSERLIEEKMRGPMPAQDVSKMLLAGGVKPEEMHWTGLEDFLKSKGNEKVTPQEIKDHLAENNLQIKEVTKGGLKNWTQQDSERLDELENSRDLTDEEEVERQQLIDRENASGDHIGIPETTKYGSYVLPGGERYREMLLTMPPKSPAPIKLNWTETKANDSLESPVFFATNGKKAFVVTQEPTGKWRVVDDPQAAVFKSSDDAKSYVEKGLAPRPDESNQFRSNHWEEPNILAHVRFNDRVGPNGEKLLHVEEVQSDMMQSMRKQRETIAQTLAGEGFYDIIKKMQNDGTIEVKC
jgi:hypothetical protein